MGRFVASFGQQMLTVAVGWEIYERTHSSLLLGFVGLTAFVPMVLMTLPAGHVADTRERKRVIISMQAVLGCTALGLATTFSWKTRAGWRGCIFVCQSRGWRALFCGRPARRFSRNWWRAMNSRWR